MPVLGDILRQTHETLAEADIPDARLEAELLLNHLLGIPKHRLYAFQEQEVSDQHIVLLQESVQRRLTREPLAYILGVKEFYGIELEVSPDVLIPRPESEYLVEQALLTSMMRAGESDWVVADVGAGSGALAISLAIHLPMARVYATENSSRAADVAARNIQRHNVEDRVILVQGNLLDDVPDSSDIIIANLPYIRSGTMAGLEPEVQWEPREALDGGEDGLDVIRDLLRQAPGKLKDGGMLLLEIDPHQASPLEEMGRSLFPQAEVSIQRDLAGHARYFIVDTSSPL